MTNDPQNTHGDEPRWLQVVGFIIALSTLLYAAQGVTQDKATFGLARIATGGDPEVEARPRRQRPLPPLLPPTAGAAAGRAAGPAR